MSSQRIAADRAEAGNGHAVTDHGTYTMGPDCAYGREQLLWRLSKFPQEIHGQKVQFNLKFEEADSHTIVDKLGDETVVPHGYYVTGLAMTQAPVRGLKGILNKGSVEEQTDELSPEAMAQALKRVFKELKVNAQYAIRCADKGVWISSAALDEALKGRYVLSQGEDFFSAKDLSGEDVRGHNLYQLLNKALENNLNLKGTVIPGGAPNEITFGSVLGGRERSDAISKNIGISPIIRAFKEAFSEVYRQQQQSQMRY